MKLILLDVYNLQPIQANQTSTHDHSLYKQQSTSIANVRAIDHLIAGRLLYGYTSYLAVINPFHLAIESAA